MARRTRTLIGENVLLTVDLASIPANNTVVVTLPVPGAKLNRGAFALPGALFGASGLVLLNSYAVADDSVKAVILNTTGSAVDIAAEQWIVLVVK